MQGSRSECREDRRRRRKRLQQTWEGVCCNHSRMNFDVEKKIQELTKLQVKLDSKKFKLEGGGEDQLSRGART